MIDVHFHILPGVATPHNKVYKGLNHRQKTFAAISDLSEALREEGIPMHVLRGQEAFVLNDFY